MGSTKVSTDYLANSTDFISQSTKTNVSNKSTSNFATGNKDDFKNVLNLKSSSKNENTQKVVDKVKDNKDSNDVKDTDTSKLDEFKEKLKELEEDSKTDSKDDVNSKLQALLDLLNKLGLKTDAAEKGENVNLELLQSIALQGTNSNESLDNKSTVLNQLIELLKSDSAQKKLDADSLELMQKMLSQLSAKLTDANKETTSSTKNGIKDLMSEISNAINNKQNQGEKVLTLEEMLSKSYSQNKDSSLENNNNGNSDTSKDNKGVSKEDKFLNSLIDDKKDSSLDKINLFASRSQVVQGQGVETTRGLTINKANFANDLIQDVKFMSNNGLKELTVKVNPGNLGEITINLIQEDGVMKANLKANSKETTALLSQNLVEIKEKLAEQNIKVSDVNIELYQEDTTFFREQGFGSQLSQEQGNNSSNNSNNNNNISDDGSVVDDNLVENIVTTNNNLDFLA